MTTTAVLQLISAFVMFAVSVLLFVATRNMRRAMKSYQESEETMREATETYRRVMFRRGR